MDWSGGDEILKEFIIDQKFTVKQCMRLFKIGSQCFYRIKNDNSKAVNLRGGQLTLNEQCEGNRYF